VLLAASGRSIGWEKCSDSRGLLVVWVGLRARRANAEVAVTNHGGDARVLPERLLGLSAF